MNLIKKAGDFLQKIGSAWDYAKKHQSMWGWAMSLGSPSLYSFNSKSSQLSEGYRNKIVYACVNVLVRKLLEPPMIVSKVKSEKALRKMHSYQFSRENQHGEYNVRQAKALDELEEHALIDLLESPNDYQTTIDLKENFWFNYELTGDGYLFAEKNESGRREGQPVFIHSLNADRVTPFRGSNDWRVPIEYYLFTAWDGTHITIYPQDLMHMTKWSPLDPLQGGYSPQRSLSLSIAKNNEGDIASASAFRNGGTGTILSSDVIVHEGNTYKKLSTEQVEKIRQTVDHDMKGSHNNGNIVVTNGMVQVQKYGDTLVDMGIITSNTADKEDICAAWGVNPILIGSRDGGTENNVKAAYKALVTNVCVFELRKFDKHFKKFMKDWYKGEKLDCSHDLTEYSELAPDLEIMKKVYGDSWQVTGNEFRKIINLDKSEDPIMEMFLIPQSLVPSQQLLEEPVDDMEDGKTYDYN